MIPLLPGFRRILVCAAALPLLHCTEATGSADEAGVAPAGRGTAADPYRIATVENLLWLSRTPGAWGAAFVQTADIDASSSRHWDGGGGFRPIGRRSAPFTGSYHGRGHSISGLTINRPSELGVGMFGTVGSDQAASQVDSLHLLEATVRCGGSCGILAGLLQYGGMDHCSSTGTVESSSGGAAIGGLIGAVSDQGRLDRVRITYCHSAASVSSGGDGVGGLIGTNGGSILASFATGDVTSRSIYVGGLVGDNSGGDPGDSIYASFATGAVTGKGAVGGLVGRTGGTWIISSFATGAVTGRPLPEAGGAFSAYDVGGLVGDNSAWVRSCYATGSVSGDHNVGGLVGFLALHGKLAGSYAAGRITANSKVGGLVGVGAVANVDSCDWDVEATGHHSSALWNPDQPWNGDVPGKAVGLTSAQMKRADSFVGWDLGGTWLIDAGSGYPRLRATDGLLPNISHD